MDEKDQDDVVQRLRSAISGRVELEGGGDEARRTQFLGGGVAFVAFVALRSVMR